MKLDRFAKYAWGVLAYNIIVILWGAYVRATGSGAGCGSHWPLCNGEVLPREPQIETLIEFTHRLSSGVAFLLVVGMFFWALRTYPKGYLVRRGAWFSLIFIITEALVGAGLVLFEWVAYDASLGRAISIVVHLINTFLLLAALSLTAWWGSGGRPFAIRMQRALGVGLLIGLLVMILLGASGALTALGDTLFPARSLVEGLQQDFSATAHFLIRLRLLHPTIAVIVSMYLLVLAGAIRARILDGIARRISQALTLLLLVQLAAGVVNVLLLAPVWMQILHLLLADAVWILLVLLTASTLAVESRETDLLETARPQPASN